MKTGILIFVMVFALMGSGGYSQTATDYYAQAKEISCETKSEIKQALELLDKALQLNSNYTDALVLRAQIFLKKESYKEEIADLTKLIQLDTVNTGYYITRAEAYTLKKDYESAINDYTTVFKIDTSKVECIYKRGMLYLEHFLPKETEKAMADFNFCSVHGSVQIRSMAYLARGRIYESQTSFDKAMNEYNTALKINPLNKDVYLYRGILKIGQAQDGCYDILKYRDMGGENAQEYLSRYCMK